MKYKIVVSILLLTIAGSVGVTLSHIYPRSGVITEISGDTVTVCDGAGEAWEFTGAEDWEVGDGVSMLMFDNFTNRITDDYIIKTRYDRR